MAKVKKKSRRKVDTEDRSLPAKKQNAESLPVFMRNEEVLGVEELTQYIAPPRVKIVQKQSGGIFEENFENGDVVLVPQNELLAPYNNGQSYPIYFTPIFFFPEWVLTNPVGVAPYIRERTTNPNDPMVGKARNRLIIPYPEDPDGDKRCKYQEHLNFLCVVHNVELPSVVVMTFARGEYMTGQNLAARIKIRGGGRAPMFGCVFQANVKKKPGTKGFPWYGFEIQNPADDSGFARFIDNEEQFKSYKELHLKYRDLHEKSMIKVDYEDRDDRAEGYEDDLEY